MSMKNTFSTSLELNYSNTNFVNSIINLCPNAHLVRIKTILTSFIRNATENGFDFENTKLNVLIHNSVVYNPSENQTLLMDENLIYPNVKGSKISIYLNKNENEDSLFIDLYFPDYEMNMTKFRKC